MGIRFRCPNGHNLHVKSFLAGKRGICPKCGVKLTIPHDAEAPAADGTASPSVSPPASQPHAAAPVVLEVADGDGSPPTGSTAASPAEPRVSAALLDKVAPGVTWYLRVASGEQYGPAPTDVFRDWIAQGRVTANCHLWREGWDDWRSGAEFITSPASAVPRVEPVAPSPDSAPSVQINTRAEPNLRRKQRKQARTLVIILTLTCLALLVPLIYIVTVGP